jgi:hypothetical protein
MEWALLVPLVIVILLVFGWLTSKKKDKSSGKGFQEKSFDQFPYQLNAQFLSPTELEFFQALRQTSASHLVVCTKVRLGDLFKVSAPDNSQFRISRNKINQKHVDFLLCETTTMRPLLGIELDDSSHQRAARQARDVFVDGVFKAAKLPLLHIPAKRAYNASEIQAQIAAHLNGSANVPSKLSDRIRN